MFFCFGSSRWFFSCSFFLSLANPCPKKKLRESRLCSADQKKKKPQAGIEQATLVLKSVVVTDWSRFGHIFVGARLGIIINITFGVNSNDN